MVFRIATVLSLAGCLSACGAGAVSSGSDGDELRINALLDTEDDNEQVFEGFETAEQRCQAMVAECEERIASLPPSEARDAQVECPSCEAIAEHVSQARETRACLQELRMCFREAKENRQPREPLDVSGCTQIADTCEELIRDPDDDLDEPDEPSDPTEPSEPADPSDPTEPSEPADPSDPTEPSEPADPSDPTEPSEPADPTDPFDDFEDLFDDFEDSFDDFEDPRDSMDDFAFDDAVACRKDQVTCIRDASDAFADCARSQTEIFDCHSSFKGMVETCEGALRDCL